MVSKSVSRIYKRAFGPGSILMMLIFIIEWAVLGIILGFLVRVFWSWVQWWYFTLPFTIAAIFIVFMIFFYNSRCLRSYASKNKIEGENEYLKDMVAELATNAGIMPPSVVMVHDNVPNVHTRGNANATYIVISDSLVALLEADELRAVLAHEIVHIKNGDPLPMYIVNVLAYIISFISLKIGTPIFRFGKEKFSDAFRRDGSIGVGEFIVRFFVALAGVIITAVGTVLLILYPFGTILTMGIRNERDYMADQGAAYLTKDPLSLIAAFDKIQNEPVLEGWMNPVRANLSVMNKYGERTLESIFLSTQPPYIRRVSRLQSIDRTFQSTGYYRERFVADEELDYASRVAPQNVFTDVCADLIEGLRNSFADDLRKAGTTKADFDKIEVDAVDFETLSKGYFVGDIVEEIPAKAFAYGLKAAQNDVGMMQVYVGACYGAGYGVEVNCDEARTWFKIASNNGCRNTVMSAYMLMKVYSGSGPE